VEKPRGKREVLVMVTETDESVIFSPLYSLFVFLVMGFIVLAVLFGFLAFFVF